MVSADEVRMAYRLFLDREPENDDVVDYFCARTATVHELRQLFLSSEEFKLKMGGGRENITILQFAPPRIGLTLGECYFYHTMDIPGVGLVEGYGWDHRAYVDDIFHGISFARKRVLEVGPASGFLTAEMDRRGAEVVSIDAPQFHKWDIIPFPGIADKWQRLGDELWEKSTNAWWFVHEHHKLRAKAYYIGAYDLDTAPLGRFDVTVLFHMLLHVRDVLKVLQICAAITDHEIIIGELVNGSMESLRLPVINLLPDPYPKPGEENYNAWWQFSTSFFTNFLAICGFTITRVHRYVLSYQGGLHESFTLVASRP